MAFKQPEDRTRQVGMSLTEVAAMTGLVLVCDGCKDGPSLNETTAIQFGRLDLVAYCADCAGVWRAYLDEEAAERTRMVIAFEAWRAAHLEQLRGRLTRLPDEA